MKQRLARLFSLMMLLSFTAQPLLLQARTIHDATPPCPMQKMQQMTHQDSAAHGDCASHVSDACTDCGLCSHSSGGVPLSPTVLGTPAYRGATLADLYHGHFASIALPVDSPPPRSL